MSNEPRPIDQRTDRPYTNLTEVMNAGESGWLARTFEVGSFWEVGPFVHDRNPGVVRVTGDPYTSGINYSQRWEDKPAYGTPCWFIPVEVVYSPTSERAPYHTGQPPHVLCPLTPRMAAVANVFWIPRGQCCRCRCSCARDQATLEQLKRENAVLKAKLDQIATIL